MTTIAAWTGGQDDLTPGTRRVDAANQRDAWLRQMELAQLAGMGGTPVHAAPAPASMSPPSHGARTPAAALAPSAAQVAARPAGPAAGADAGASPDRAPATCLRRAESMDSTEPARPLDDARIALAGPMVPGAPVPAARTDAAGPDDVLPDIALAPAVALLPTGPAAASAMLARGDALQAAPPVPVAAPVALGAAAPLRANGPVAPAAQAPAPDRAPDTADAPAWQKRVMHLTGDGDDVKLWIRDGELSPAQTQQLVARLAGDVAATGLRLKEATVNGKPALRASRHDDAPAEAFVPPITHPTTER